MRNDRDERRTVCRPSTDRRIGLGSNGYDEQLVALAMRYDAPAPRRHGDQADEPDN